MLKYDWIIRAIRKNRTLLLVLASLVVVITTYMLVLPAFTLDANKAKEQGGIDVGASTKELEFDGGSYTVKCTLSSKDAASIQASEKEDKKAESLSVDSEHESSEAASDEEPSEKSEEEQVKETKSEDTGKAGIDLDVKELTKKDKDYSDYVKKAEKLVAKELDKNESNRKIVASSVYDISLMSDGEEKEPEEPVSVTLEYDKVKKMSGADDVRIVHFAVNNGKETAELLDPDDVSIETKKDGIKAVNFKAESFSVYAIVYTVDFAYEVDGETYQWSMEGGKSISLKKLLSILKVFDKSNIDADLFMSEIDKVAFTDESLVKVEKDGDDYKLVSLKPFTTEETLTITMKNGDEIIVKVTDAQSDAIHNTDGTVQTITNPAGTTFDLFNYYVDSSTKTKANRYQWPGHVNGNDVFAFNWYNLDGTYACSRNEGYNQSDDWKRQHLLGYGNNLGINQGHVFKFTPANAGTVIDGTKGIPTVDGDAGGVNSWTEDADPRIIANNNHYVSGIVQGTLDGGYPKLTNNTTLGTDGTSLNYLFDDTTQNGKERYPGVDKLLYVDKDGYYTYDSRDFKAYYNEGDNTFTVSDQPDSSDTELKGFWPFGDQIFWCGLHMNTQFSMPANGQVLNPKEKYKDMQFEFSGDDDTWLYIDGVLVGDGGGIHNRTEIDINFAKGTVLLTGRKDTVHTGTFEDTRYLDDIFRAAGRYKEDEWEDIGDGSGHKRFKAGTYHTFDMFYLERGGGESNLYIHYNLVSTSDFTGHKAYENFGEDERMHRDQFHFELIGLDGQYQSIWNESTQTATVTKLNDTKHAIMPVGGTSDGAGTVSSPKKEHVEKSWDGMPGTVYTTGVTEDGNINFGNADISAEEMHNCDEGHPSQYRYVIREIVPDDALNEDGIRWDKADDATKAAGGFVKDSVRYDETVYYMTATVMSWDQTGTDGNTYKRYGLRKAYYTDDTFTTLKPDTTFIDFQNKYSPVIGKVDFDKVDGSGQPLPGAQFTLYDNAACTNVAKDINDNNLVVTSDASGKVKFENVIAGTYYMKETQAPSSDYQLDNTVYKVTIVDERDRNRKSTIVVNGDNTNNPVTTIHNVKKGELSVIKKWVDQNGEIVNTKKNSVNLKLYRYRRDNPISHVIHVTVKSRDHWQKSENTVTVTGNSASISWDDNGQYSWDRDRMPVKTVSVNGVFIEDHTANGGNNPYFVLSNLSSAPAGTIDVVFEYYKAGPDAINDSWFLDGYLNNKNVTIQDNNDGMGQEIKDPDFEKEFSINKGNNWAQSFKVGGTDSDYQSQGFDIPSSNGQNAYKYYVVEVDENGQPIEVGQETAQGYKLIEYSDSNATGVSEQGIISVTNQVTKGDLTITKDLLGDVTGNEDKPFKVTIKNSDELYLQEDKISFSDTPFEFSVSKATPLEITDIPIDTYTVNEITGTDNSEVNIEGFRFNLEESTITANTVVDGGETKTVEIKNYYNEEYTPEPSDTNEFTNLEVDKSWIKKDGSTTPADTDIIKFKVNVKSANAYIPVKWDLYDGRGATQKNELSDIAYVEAGTHVDFVLTRYDDHASPGSSFFLNCNVPLTNGSGITRTYKDRIPCRTNIAGGSWNTQSKVYTVGSDVNTYIDFHAQPWKPSARWVSGIPSNAGEWHFDANISGNKYDSVAEMQEALISEDSPVETLVFTMNKDGIQYIANESSCSVTPESTSYDNWVATLNSLPTYQKIEDSSGNISYKVYSYEIDEIEVNGERVVNNSTEHYDVMSSTSTSSDITTTTIVNTEKPDITITLEKYDINDIDKQNADKLPGASFRLEKYTDDTYRNIDSTWPSQTLLDSDNTGSFTFTDVKEGFYKLTEINCPAGYVKTSDDIRFKASVTQGQVIITLLDNTGHAVSGNQLDDVRVSNTTIKYGNTSGAELPSAGGPGTHWIYFIGMLLAVGCSVMLIARKRARR